MRNPEYLGDGVYIKHDGIAITLMTGSHDHPDNTIVLEPFVLKAFDTFRKEANL